MAYTLGEFQLVVTGHLSSSETWTNTWTFDDNAGTGDRADAVTDLRQFYTDIKGHWPLAQAADSCVEFDLVSSVGTPVTWAAITGTTSAASLPTECSIKISLDDLGGHHGGCYLPCGTINTLQTSGLITTAVQGQVATAVENLHSNLDGHNIDLRFNRPSVSQTADAKRVKVGLVYDVIRRRRNAIPEAYDVRSL